MAGTSLFDHALYRFLTFNAWASNELLGALGQGTRALGTTIRSSAYAINVRRGCDSTDAAWFFCAAVLAFPALPSRKLLGALAGTLLILSANIIRIVSLFLIGRLYPRLFDSVHLEVWPVAFILMSVFLWIAWMGWARPRQRIERA